MPIHPTRLMKLARLEYERGVEQPQAPARKSFKAKRVRLAAFDRSWDLKRGSAARLMSVLLNEDSEELQARVERLADRRQRRHISEPPTSKYRRWNSMNAPCGA